jgi:hydrogenase maturation factor
MTSEDLEASSTTLPVGKLPAALLAALLARLAPAADESILIGPRPGEDAAAVRIGEQALVLATDPITFATARPGWYAVHVNANDVAVCGADPRWFLATVLLPAGADPALPAAIADEIAAACAEVGATLIGGHTEVTAGLDRPIVVGIMAGLADPAALIRTGGARPGDRLVLTQGAAVEGTALIATERAAEVDARFGADFGARCRDFLRTPGLSVVAAARLARAHGATALHDPTEGGIATGLREMAAASDCGLRVDREAIYIFPETRALCDHFGLDPLGLIASGALLAAVPADHVASLLAACAAAGLPASDIGVVMPAAEGCVLLTPDGPRELPTFARDEVARLFE